MMKNNRPTLYNKLSLYERLIYHTCFNAGNDQSDSEKAKNLTFDDKLKRINNATFFLKKYLGNDFFDSISNKSVLDFGCGKGQYTLSMARNAQNVEVTGFDLHDGYKIYNGTEWANYTNNVSFICGDDNGHMTKNKFDVVLSWNSFEHFQDAEKVLNEMVEYCKPGGKLIVKFGPTWKSPYGRHMFDTMRKDRPWFHLFLGEKSVMRVYSAIRKRDRLYESWEDYPDGMNKMTVKKARKIFYEAKNVQVKSFKVVNHHWFSNYPWIVKMGFLSEYISDSVICFLEKKNQASSNG